MKSPEQLSSKLAQQWQRADLRVQRLLLEDGWPLTLPIGKPAATDISQSPGRVREHIQQWRAVSVGKVEWQDVSYRAAGQAVSVPVRWHLANATEWVEATKQKQISTEFSYLCVVMENVSSLFHELVIRRPALHKGLGSEQLIQVCQVAQRLDSQCAGGVPLRALGLDGIDSKFFERHRSLLLALLDLRFDGQASEMGLEEFLGAQPSGAHWLLLVDLDGALLPFEQLRVRSSELADWPWEKLGHCGHLLIVENENCVHLLPRLPGTLAVLGSGLDLAWMNNSKLRQFKVGYWGDMDSWGLLMLARARGYCPSLRCLLMSKALYLSHQKNAVPEPIPAPNEPPVELSAQEQAFFQFLLNQDSGRLEQEFLPASLVATTLQSWGHTP